jgi:hypothetical protein
VKVLFDPIYSTQPDRCSSASKFKKIALQLLAARPDLFIYWPVPPWANEQARDWLPKSERIRYLEFRSFKDRVREYQLFGGELENLVSFFGEFWDYDVLITMRTAQVPTMRVSMNSPRLARVGWLKKVVLLEEMAILDFRKTVPVSAPAVQDALTVLGYLAADVSYITAQHVRHGILMAARDSYAPSKVRELDRKLRLVNPSILEEVETKPPERRFKRGEEPFCLGFVGRMSNSMTRLPDVYEVMDKQWIMKGDKGFKVLISTVSTAVKLPPPEFVVLENNPRDKFWARLKEDMHLVISLSIDAEFSMSLIEPVLFGTPLVIAREDWTEGLLGKEYPFFVEGKAQAYGMVHAWHDDYEGLYAKFLDWREHVFLARFAPGGPYSVNLYADLLKEVATFDLDVAATFSAKSPGKKDNEMARQIIEEGGDEFVLFEVVKRLAEKGVLRNNVEAKLKPDFADTTNTTFLTPWHELKVIAQAFYGYRDASVTVGHFRRASP